MPRHILAEAQIHPAIRERIATRNSDLVEEVMAAVASEAVVIVGMRQNPFPRKARKSLDAAGIPFCYLEYGSYLPGSWRRRNALKMWTGWETFPMIWIEGVFVGGFADLDKLLASGELSHLVAGGVADG